MSSFTMTWKSHIFLSPRMFFLFALTSINNPFLCYLYTVSYSEAIIFVLFARRQSLSCATGITGWTCGELLRKLLQISRKMNIESAFMIKINGFSTLQNLSKKYALLVWAGFWEWDVMFFSLICLDFPVQTACLFSVRRKWWVI